ncbi:MAG TPA: hypothetical protein DEP36_02470 [Gammaproteobacteria bacterium]|nr:hypothetical protein [Gammaproteobacteria bacterium]
MPAKLPDDIALERYRAGNRQRSLKRRERLEHAGNKQLLCWIPAVLRKQLDEIASEHNDTVSNTVTMIIHAGIAALTASIAPTPATGSQPIDKASNKQPNDRAALADVAHQMRKEGMTVAMIAAEFNKRGWTPEAIPKQGGTKPRSDAAVEWTVKSLSQLMNRDHPTVSL